MATVNGKKADVSSVSPSSVQLEKDYSPKWLLFNTVSGQTTSDAAWKYGEVFLLITYLYFLRAVVNIPTQTLESFSP